MKNIFKNFLLFIAVLVLSYFTASYFGSWYDKFSPQYDFSFFNLQREQIIFLAGLPLAYVFFIPFIFELLGAGKRRKLILWLLVPPLIFWLSADRYYIYLPAILGLIGFALAYILRLVASKFRHPNPPMVIK